MAGFVCECCGERTELFGQGGGKGMAGEEGVGFLGGVEVDGAWGRLVEEGRRPSYGGVGGGEGEGGKGEGEEGGRDEALLVDKYRSCKLSETFEGIAARVVGIVEGEDGGG